MSENIKKLNVNGTNLTVPPLKVAIIGGGLVSFNNKLIKKLSLELSGKNL